MRRGLATVALLTVLLAGCGGGSDDADPSPSATTAGGRTPGSVDTNFTGKDSEQFCSLARGYRERIDRLATTDPTQLKAITEEAQASVKDFVATAPAEIKDSVQLVAAASTAFFQALAKADYDLTKLSPSSLAGLNTPQAQDATAELGAYTEKVCGISTSIVTSIP